MFIRIETSSGVPITRQIADQVRAQCASGTLRPGDRLPSVRALARQLAVNQNTILRVYERLTAERLLERRHGSGTFVSQQQPAGQLRQQHEQLRREAARLIEHARNLDLNVETVRRLIDEAARRRDGNGHARGDGSKERLGEDGNQAGEDSHG